MSFYIKDLSYLVVFQLQIVLVYHECQLYFIR